MDGRQGGFRRFRLGVIRCRDYRRRSDFRRPWLSVIFPHGFRSARFLRIFCPACRDLFQPLLCHRSRNVVDFFVAGRSVEIDPVRTSQNGLAICRSHLPHRQHGAGVRGAPAERFDQSLRGAARERADLIRLDRERLRPRSAQKLYFKRAFQVAAFLLSLEGCRHGLSLAAGSPLIKTENNRRSFVIGRATASKFSAFPRRL